MDLSLLATVRGLRLGSLAKMQGRQLRPVFSHPVLRAHSSGIESRNSLE